MEALLNQLRELPSRFSALSTGLKAVVLGALALALAGSFAVVTLTSSDRGWPYAFTGMTAEDASAGAALLKGNGVPFRLDAGGTAIAVPESKVYDARLLLAASGLPRASGVGFEIFDRGDLGVSEFTQRVNLQRALEGELSRTVGSLREVRSARVHVTLAERSFYRDEARPASAAVVVSLQPGRSLDPKQIAGIRHLVSSAVPGLAPEGVSILDGNGAVLAGEDGASNALTFQSGLERELENRVVGLLEPVVGPGAVVARVSAALDSSEQTTSAEAYDPDSQVVRSERRVTSTQSQDSGAAGGVAGAAANQPLAQADVVRTTGGNRGQSASEEEVKNYEIAKTVTRTVERAPRVRRLSVAVLVDGVDGKPRAADEVAPLGDLVKRAVGFDAERGDTLEIRSAPFAKPAEQPAAEKRFEKPWWLEYALGAAAFVALMVVLLLMRGKGSPRPAALPAPGRRVREIEAALGVEPPLSDAAAQALPSPESVVRERARLLAQQDPARAAHLLRAWLANDAAREVKNGG